MTQSPIAAAVRLLRENAEELKQSHTLAGLAEWPACEDEVKAVYDEQIAVAAALEAMLNQHHAQEAQPVTVDVPASGAAALSEYLKTCEQQAIVPDVGGAFASAFIAGFNLAASKAARGAVAEQALLKVLHAVQHYLPPDGVSARDTLTTIIEVVDPWPLDQAPSAVPAPDERAAFEHFMRIDTSGFTLERHDDGNYKEFEIATYWHFWQARAALAATPAAVPYAAPTDQEIGKLAAEMLWIDLPADGNMMKFMRAFEALVLARAMAATPKAAQTYIEVRECSDCGHIGINDDDGSKAACNTCDWQGESPVEDRCPGCNKVGTMTAACSKCGARASLLAETTLNAEPTAPTAAAPVVLPEPVATIYTMEALAPGGAVKYHAQVHKSLPSGTKLLAEPDVRALLAQAATAAAPQAQADARDAELYRHIFDNKKALAVCVWGDTASRWLPCVSKAAADQAIAAIAAAKGK